MPGPDDPRAVLEQECARLRREVEALRRRLADLGADAGGCTATGANDSAADLLEEQVQVRTADLERALREAEAANRAKSVFVANISHDIRSPLTAIVGVADLLERAREDQRSNLLAVLRHSAELLHELVDDVLDISRIEAGQLELRTGVVDVDEVVERGVAPARQLARHKKLAFALTVDPIPPLVGDSARIGQIVANLVGNAVKFTSRGDVGTRVRYRDGALEIVVTDTGIGLSSDQLATVFDPFRQATDVAADSRGTGLGLAICRAIADAMGGTVDATSGPGVGSTFTARLPMPTGAADATDPPVSVAGLSVLLAEDDALSRTLIGRMLGRLEVQFETVADGPAALAALQARSWDVCMLDCQMPGMDGVETARRARAAGVRTALVALTASATADMRARCQEVGMVGFIGKPVDSRTLARELAVYARPTR